MTTRPARTCRCPTTSPPRPRPFNHAVARLSSATAPMRPSACGPAARRRPRLRLRAHVLKGYFAMLAFNAGEPACRPRGAGHGAAASPPAPRGASRRTSMRWRHWVGGDIDGTLGDLGADPRRASPRRAGLPAAPLPCVLVRPARADGARRPTRRCGPGAPSLPAGPPLLACRCFAHEELGNYAVAEASGREAIALAPGDLWAAHGVAHVLEMQGRHEEGIAWLAGLEPNWEGGNNLNAPSVVASRALSFRAPRVRRGARPLRPPLPQPRLAADPGAARHLHRRAERSLHAVPPGAAGRRRRATAGTSWPTRPKRASAIASPPSRCRTG